MYKVLAVVWSLIALGWFLHWIRYRHFNISLQSVLTILPLTFVTFSIPMLYYWHKSNETGYRPQGLYWLSFALGTLGRAFQYGLLMVIGRGWAIIRKHINREVTTTIAVAIPISIPISIPIPISITMFSAGGSPDIVNVCRLGGELCVL